MKTISLFRTSLTVFVLSMFLLAGCSPRVVVVQPAPRPAKVVVVKRPARTVVVRGPHRHHPHFHRPGRVVVFRR